jgi:hypothetical protein
VNEYTGTLTSTLLADDEDTLTLKRGPYTHDEYAPTIRIGNGLTLILSHKHLLALSALITEVLQEMEQ